MMPNPLYQALVEVLESELPPRVVSVVLREALAEVGASPATIDHETAEAVLRGHVFRRLQHGGRSPADARSAVAEMGSYLQATVPVAPPVADTKGPADEADDADASPPPPPPAPSADVTAALELLQTSLRPLNIYFSWPEVRKLRSLVQLAEDEARSGGDAAPLLTEAGDQLHRVEQKLEDHLVLQAQVLADLERVLEAVTPLGTPAVRRLETLVATVREAQIRRTLVEAEVERAEKLARELRKLVESTIVEGDALPDLGRGDGRPRAPNQAPDRGAADPPPARPAPTAPQPLAAETQDRLRALDVEGEARDLEALVARHAELLRHVPALDGAWAALRLEHIEGRPVGERLAQLEATWRAQAEARRLALRGEFAAMRDELAGMPPEIDVTDLRRSLTVVLDVLQDGLPAIEDVATVRELHALAVTRRDEALDRERGRAARQLEQRQQLDDVRRRLAEAWDESAGTPRLEAARDRLRLVLDDLPSDADTDERTAARLEGAHDAVAAWERAVAEASDDHQERWRARTRELAARLAPLPDLAGLRARTLAVRQEIVEAERRGGLDEDQVQALAHLVDQLSADARGAVATRLDEVAREAGEPAPPALLRALQAAARQLDEGGFPDLEDVEREVRATRDVLRSGLRRRYLRARQEAHRLASAGVEATKTLDELVAHARTAIESEAGGDAAVERLERQLELVEEQIVDRLSGFGGRLDTALAEFATVARLNNDDVAAVRRVLQHLDDQRDAVARVSPGLQAQLFASLSEAEATLVGLRTVYETTRAIADQLVSGSAIDDLLGSFDGLFGPDEPSATASPESVDEETADEGAGTG
jgi:chromosome segregation protein